MSISRLCSTFNDVSTAQEVDVWNSLPNYVVWSDSVNTFKVRIGKFWQDQEVVNDFRTEIHGTGSRCFTDQKLLYT